jgi:hypothetical protein
MWAFLEAHFGTVIVAIVLCALALVLSLGLDD